MSGGEGRRPRRRPALSINISPLIDVVFILLVFVVLTARFVEREQLEVRVPQSEAGRPAASEEPLHVLLRRDGTLLVEDRPIEAARLPEVLRAARAGHPSLLLIADEGAALQGAVDVLSAASAAGFEKTAIATRPVEESAGPR